RRSACTPAPAGQRGPRRYRSRPAREGARRRYRVKPQVGRPEWLDFPGAAQPECPVMSKWRSSVVLAALLALGLVSSPSPAKADPVARATLGAAFTGGDIALYQQAIANGLPLGWAREFWNGSVPANLTAWRAAAQADQLGMKLWLSIDMAP